MPTFPLAVNRVGMPAAANMYRYALELPQGYCNRLLSSVGEDRFPIAALSRQEPVPPPSNTVGNSSDLVNCKDLGGFCGLVEWC